MSTLLVKHLISKGSKKITILNRSNLRAEALRDEFTQCEFDIRQLPELMQVVSESDAIFAASCSKNLLLLKDEVAEMCKCPEVVGGLRRFIDISVPRNIDPKINDLKGHSVVYNVD